MCVTCSNLRLSGSFGARCSPEELCGDVSMIEQTGNEYWYKRLTDGANELAVSIQNSTQSKKLESTSDPVEDSMDHREEADAKRMETVLIYAFLQVLRFYINMFHLCLKYSPFVFLFRFFIS